MAENAEDQPAAISFLFEGSEPTIQKNMHFRNFDGVTVASATVDIIDNIPGAVQSGHYLWPAAPVLAQYIVDNDSDSKRRRIVELGAGCGLVSLVALQVYHPDFLLVSDHDHTNLERAKGNFRATLDPARMCPQEIEACSKVAIQWECLPWGDIKSAKSHQKFDLILGSDLIYDITIVSPLLKTVSMLLGEGDDCQFLSSQSFAYGNDEEQEIDAVCDNLGLKRTILEDKEGVKVQSFRWRT